MPATSNRVHRIAAVILAAGRSRRMGAINKLLADVGGRPMLAWAVDAALHSHADRVLVVTGHDAQKVRRALSDRPVGFVQNDSYDKGLSSSLAKGIGALGDDADGALICLGDMPRLTADHLDRLIAAFAPEDGAEICVPVHAGRRGNPVLWGRRFFAEISAIAGDRGARDLIRRHGDAVREVAMPDDAVLFDVDTPDALAANASAAGADR
jgi:molybdenum cofactor cytidylyltransferase